MQFKLVAILTLVAASVNGAVLNKRSDPCTCAGRAYSAVDTQTAINQGRTGGVYGRNRYAHTFNSYDVAIDFTPRCTPPFLVEFPLVAGGVYTGGNPGLDRVVYDLSGDFCGCMTHTGAVGNGFVHC
ncbi:ribonuclease T1 [Thelephora terrestris]|uniref:Ribonuclease T1 n=1 Tax=Thelephora terrestris TaxID=56493 RepID=A0A9P6HID2_9AGAM|nr:ribonuclease T1 [Thelephora terrestris]